MTTLGCADCGRVFFAMDEMNWREPMHLSKPWWASLDKADDES